MKKFYMITLNGGTKMQNNLGRVGVIGRFKPLHNGAAVLLESLCEKSDHVLIGIGSSNKYNIRNPFTSDETKDMIELFLKEKFTNYEIIKIPDFAHIPGCENGQQWRKLKKQSIMAAINLIALMSEKYNMEEIK